MEERVINELIGFVKEIKRSTNVGLDKHLCDHLIDMIEDYKKLKRINNDK